MAHAEYLTEEYKFNTEPGKIFTLDEPTIRTEGRFLFPETVIFALDCEKAPKKLLKRREIVYVALFSNEAGTVTGLDIFLGPKAFKNVCKNRVASLPAVDVTVHVTLDHILPPSPEDNVESITRFPQLLKLSGAESTTVGTTTLIGFARETLIACKYAYAEHLLASWHAAVITPDITVTVSPISMRFPVEKTL